MKEQRLVNFPKCAQKVEKSLSQKIPISSFNLNSTKVFIIQKREGCFPEMLMSGASHLATSFESAGDEQSDRTVHHLQSAKN